MTPETCAKIAIDSLSNRPYPTAPVSDLYLYGHKQDLAFEKPTNDVQNRGHIRLWDTHTETNHEEVWIGSATYDHGIEIGSNTHLPTHHISPSVDKERDRVYQALRPYVRSEAVASFAQPNLFGKNGAVDWYYTDGDSRFIHADFSSRSGFHIFLGTDDQTTNL